MKVTIVANRRPDIVAHCYCYCHVASITDAIDYLLSQALCAVGVEWKRHLYVSSPEPRARLRRKEGHCLFFLNGHAHSRYCQRLMHATLSPLRSLERQSVHSRWTGGVHRQLSYQRVPTGCVHHHKAFTEGLGQLVQLIVLDWLDSVAAPGTPLIGSTSPGNGRQLRRHTVTRLPRFYQPKTLYTRRFASLN